MKKMLTRGRRIALPLLLGCCGSGQAQMLGTPQAEAWLGRPLEMTVPARFASTDSRDQCIHADVFFGENRVPANYVRATLHGGQQDRRVRIVTDSLINEPIVTVSLRAGCSSTITRNYTLLPDLPSEQMLARLARMPGASPAAAPLPATGPVRDPAPAPASAPATPPLRMARVTAPAARTTAGPAAAAPLKAGAPQRTRTARAFRPDQPVATAPRLRLEPIEMQEQATLRVTNQLASPAGEPAQRATAALLWQAINADPQELVRTTAMLQKLEADLAQMRLSAQATRAEMAALRRRLDQAQPWHASPVVAQLLALLLIGAAGTAGVMLYRARRRGAATIPWHESVDPLAPDSTMEPAGADAAASAAALVEPEPLPVPAVSKPQQRVAPAPAEIGAAVQAGTSPRGGPGPIDFELSELPGAAGADRADRAGSGVLRVETLAATLEEVEFLASLGLDSDAMDVLKAYLQDSASPAPLAFYELMRLCDEGEDATAIGTVRRRYVQTFGLEAPRLEQVTAQLGLESLGALSARITAAWGRPEVLEIIEEALFQVPEPGAALTLQAGRDLVCLYDLALNLAAEGSTQAGDSDADGPPLAPWADAADAQAAAQAAAEALGGHHFALDIDLNADPAALPEPVASEAPEDPELAPFLAEMQASAAREAEARRRLEEEEDAFSAAVASERVPFSRY